MGGAGRAQGAIVARCAEALTRNRCLAWRGTKVARGASGTEAPAANGVGCAKVWAVSARGARDLRGAGGAGGTVVALYALATASARDAARDTAVISRGTKGARKYRRRAVGVSAGGAHKLSNTAVLIRHVQSSCASSYQGNERNAVGFVERRGGAHAVGASCAAACKGSHAAVWRNLAHAVVSRVRHHHVAATVHGHTRGK